MALALQIPTQNTGARQILQREFINLLQVEGHKEPNISIIIVLSLWFWFGSPDLTVVMWIQ
jgi:hypothetical protein